MNFNSTAGNYFRSAAHVGVRQKVARRRAYDLPGGLLLWKAVAKAMLWGLPLVLAANLWCASAIDSNKTEYAAVQQELNTMKADTEKLVLAKERLLSPVRVKIAAAEKLSLHEPAAGQVRHM